MPSKRTKTVPDGTRGARENCRRRTRRWKKSSTFASQALGSNGKDAGTTTLTSGVARTPGSAAGRWSNFHPRCPERATLVCVRQRPTGADPHGARLPEQIERGGEGGARRRPPGRTSQRTRSSSRGGEARPLLCCLDRPQARCPGKGTTTRRVRRRRRPERRPRLGIVGHDAAGSGPRRVVFGNKPRITGGRCSSRPWSPLGRELFNAHTDARTHSAP